MASDEAAPRPLASAVLTTLRQLATEIDRLDQLGADRFQLSRTDVRALDLIWRHDSLAPTELARLLGFTTGGVTGVLDRLERAGYVRRLPDPSDRRRLLLKATSAVAAMDQEVFGRLLQTCLERIGTYTETDLRLINSFLERIRDAAAIYADSLASSRSHDGKDRETPESLTALAARAKAVGSVEP